jgi:hypothetical protein
MLRHRSSFSLFILLFIPVIACTQIKIREKVELRPRAGPPRSSQGTTSTSITIHLVWDTDDDATLYADSWCGQSPILSESGPRSKTYTIQNAYAGNYQFRVFYYGCTDLGRNPVPPANITATLTFGGDTTVVFQGTVPPRFNCAGAPMSFDFSYSTPYANSFGIAPDFSRVYDSRGTSFGIWPVYNCTFARWYPDRDSVKLAIVSGSECGKFSVTDGPARDTAVTLLSTDFSSLRFVPTGHLGAGPVLIEARSGDVVDTISLEVKYSTILLGETKYFYGVLEDREAESGEISQVMRIRETMSPSLPPGALANDIWKGDPYDTNAVRLYADEVNSALRLGVYWEKNKPVPNHSGNLPTGMIRLVGRYWDPDSVFTVQLLARSERTGDVITVEVKRPTKLGGTMGRARDVFDREINIDDSCITYGAKYGIPPHFLKAQISKESPPGTFTFDDGNTESGFAPGYRFEPYTTQFTPKIKKLIKKENPFVVLPNSLREPPPPDHQHVRYMDYIRGAPVKVWHFVENYSQLVDPTRSGVYGIRRSDGRMDFDKLGYETLQKEFDLMFDYFRDPRGGSLGLREILSVQEAADSAREHMIDFLKNRWKDGLNNVVAQSRIAASYGLFQTLYPTGLLRGYPADIEYLPEGLNIPEINFPLSVQYQDSLLRSDKSLGSKFESEGNWPLGLEGSFKRYVYPIWNEKSDYGNEVIKRFSLFLPKN